MLEFPDSKGVPTTPTSKKRGTTPPPPPPPRLTPAQRARCQKEAELAAPVKREAEGKADGMKDDGERK